jgi:hypothetical protein
MSTSKFQNYHTHKRNMRSVSLYVLRYWKNDIALQCYLQAC